MVKTKNGMKWLVVALLLVIAIGAVLLSFLSLHAKADSEKVTFRIMVSSSSTRAKSYAVSKGWMESDKSIRGSTTISAANDAKFTMNPVSYESTVQLGLAFGFEGTSGSHYGQYRSLTRWLADNNKTWSDVEEVVFYLLDDYHNYSNGTQATIGSPNVKAPMRIVGVTDYTTDNKLPEMLISTTVPMIQISNDLTLDHMIVRGAPKKGDAGQFAVQSGNDGRYSTVYMNEVIVNGFTLNVINDAAIYDGNATGDATALTYLFPCGPHTGDNGKTNDYNDIRIDRQAGSTPLINSTRGDSDTVGRLNLQSGTYRVVQLAGRGKIGIRSTKYTADPPTAESVDVTGLTGEFCDFATAARRNYCLGSITDKPDGYDEYMATATNWYHMDFNAGAADAYVTVGGTANITRLSAGGVTYNATKDTYSSGNASCLTGAGVTAHLTVEGGTIGQLDLNWGYGSREISGSHYWYSATQFGNIEATITGGTINLFRGGAQTANFGLASGNPHGQSHSYGDLTVDILGGTFTGTFYTAFNSDTQQNGVDAEGTVIHGDIHYTFGIQSGEHAGEGPTFTGGGPTMRTVQGSLVLAAEASHVIDVYGGTYDAPFWAVASSTLCKTTEVNLYGGHFAHVGGGFAGGVTGTGITNVTEDLSGKNLASPVRTIITVDGAEIEEMYGGRSGTTNPNGRHNFSIRNVLKSGTIGKYFLLSDANQTGRVGADDAAADELIYWTTLGDPSYNKNTKPLTIGEYYAAGEYTGSNDGLDRLYCANAMLITQAYQNVVLDANALGGTYSGEFYALGRETNPDGANSGAYYVDVVLDTHGFDIDSRTNDSLFANVRAEGALSTVPVDSSITINIADAAITKGVPTDDTLDTDDGLLINNIVANPNTGAPGEITIDGKTDALDRTVPVYKGDVKINLTNVTIGDSEAAFKPQIHLLQTMQYQGDISTTLTGCTLYGDFAALSNATTGIKGTTYEASNAFTKKTTVTNTLTDTEITGIYLGSGINTYIISDITNILTDCTIGAQYFGGMRKLNGLVGSDGTAATQGGVFAVGGSAGSGALSIGTITNTLDGTSVSGAFYGANGNCANRLTTITNNMLGGTVIGAGGAGNFLGSGNASSTIGDVTNNIVSMTCSAYIGFGGSGTLTGSVTNTITGLTANGNYYGGTATTGTFNGSVTNHVVPGAAVTINGNFVGGANTKKISGSVTNTIEGAVTCKYYYGGTNATGGSVTGNVANTINGLAFSQNYYGGSLNGNIGGSVTNTIYKMFTDSNETEMGVYFGSNNGDITGSVTTVINPAQDGDVFFNGIVALGSYSGDIGGNVSADVCGGVQYSNRHFIVGNRQDVADKAVRGTATANIYGGSWGTVFLGARNNDAKIDVSGITSVVGGTTLNLYGGSVGVVRKGYYNSSNGWTNSSYGTATVNVYTTTPASMPTGATLRDLVIRSSIDGVRQTFTGEGMTANAPYTVNVTAGDRPLYYAANGYVYASGDTSSRNATGTLTADSITGTLIIRPVNNAGTNDPYYANNPYYYPITAFGATGYKTGADADGILYCGVLGQYDWNETLDEATNVAIPMVTLKGETDQNLVNFTNTTYSRLTYALVDGNATWSPTDMRLRSHYGTQIVMSSKFTVRVLFDAAKYEAAQTGVVITCAVNDGEAETMTLTKGATGTAQEGYYYFDVDGISAAEYKTTKFNLTIAFDDLPVRDLSFTGATIITDMTGSGNENLVTLGTAIDEFTTAIAAYFADSAAEIDAGTVTDVTDTQVDAMLAAKSDKVPTTDKIEVAENIKVVGVNLKITDVITINFWFRCENDATINSATLGDATLGNGLVLQTRDAENGYYSVNYEMDAGDLASMLTMKINGSDVEFNACPLSYAKALKAQNENLAQAIINYAYYVESFAV